MFEFDDKLVYIFFFLGFLVLLDFGVFFFWVILLMLFERLIKELCLLWVGLVFSVLDVWDKLLIVIVLIRFIELVGGDMMYLGIIEGFFGVIFFLFEIW